MKIYQSGLFMVCFLAASLSVGAQFNNAVISRVSSESSDKLRFSAWLETKKATLGESVTIYYAVENSSEKTFFLVKERETRIRLYGENLLVEAPNALPTNHGEFDFEFLEIGPQKTIRGRITLPKEKVDSEGVLPISVGFGYVGDIAGINRTPEKVVDPAPLRGELERRIKRLYLGDLSLLIHAKED